MPGLPIAFMRCCPGGDLSGADKGEVLRPEEQDLPLAHEFLAGLDLSNELNLSFR
jgi:hypothetical protein